MIDPKEAPEKARQGAALADLVTLDRVIALAVVGVMVMVGDYLWTNRSTVVATAIAAPNSGAVLTLAVAFGVAGVLLQRSAKALMVRYHAEIDALRADIAASRLREVAAEKEVAALRARIDLLTDRLLAAAAELRRHGIDTDWGELAP